MFSVIWMNTAKQIAPTNVNDTGLNCGQNKLNTKDENFIFFTN